MDLRKTSMDLAREEILKHITDFGRLFKVEHPDKPESVLSYVLSLVLFGDMKFTNPAITLNDEVELGKLDSLSDTELAERLISANAAALAWNGEDSAPARDIIRRLLLHCDFSKMLPSEFEEMQWNPVTLCGHVIALSTYELPDTVNHIAGWLCRCIPADRLYCPGVAVQSNDSVVKNLAELLRFVLFEDAMILNPSGYFEAHPVNGIEPHALSGSGCSASYKTNYYFWNIQRALKPINIVRNAVMNQHALGSLD